MFRNRRNSQKPNDELYASFKASFPQLQTTTSAQAPGSTSLTDALDVALHTRHFGDGEDIRDQDPTPRGSNEPWRFTPSVLDPNSFAFASFANQPPGYYTPTPGGTNTIYHSQAGDLHTPGFSFGLGTPLSLPTSEGALHVGQSTTAAMPSFTQQAMAPHHFHSSNPFAMQHHSQQQQHPQQHHPQHQPFMQHQYPHDQGSIGHLEQAPQDHSEMDDVQHGIPPMQPESPVLSFPQSYDSTALRHTALQPQNENFRYHVTLNAPTAMIKHADEIPVTYLNKGQAYSLNVVDTCPAQLPSGMVRYRTFVRISFEDQQQRQRPGACWQLWKEGRGTNEAHHRGGRLQAVEFVESSQIGTDAAGRPTIELETASFDGFSVTWSPAHNGSADCSLAVRFNFLSTDFSHSKGVKGIPVRLCTKTEVFDGQVPASPHSSTAEICYCKVKLFRDHGAERKLSNDIAHVKKTIDKLKQLIAQAETGMKDFGKRKRSGSASKAVSNRPGKVPKHKRTWSMSSASSTGRGSQEEDLHLKLATLQDMFTSTRPASVLYLRGEEQDDPDLHPVHLTGEPQDLTKVEPLDSSAWEKQSGPTTATSSIVSPTPSVHSLQSFGRRSSTFQQPAPFNAPSRIPSNEWRNMPQTATGDIQAASMQQQMSTPPDIPIKVMRSQQPGGAGTLSGWIEALGVDYTYQPPPERVVKPIACFYVLPRVVGKVPEDNYYRAVYLMQRTLKDLVNGVAAKCDIEPTKVVRTIHLNRAGLSILLDDESVRELPEGQDMTAELHELAPRSPMKAEWESGPIVDGDISTVENVQVAGYELRLLF